MHITICKTNDQLVQVQCMKQGTQNQCSETTQTDGVGRDGLGWGGHMYTCGQIMLMYAKTIKIL